ncbi:hypothetical protein [Salinicola halophyticus]|uniref:hypothetical protein n=1 Tax=Salinicola halophyticus TaxID=1808881 RepID=UPI003F455DF6
MKQIDTTLANLLDFLSNQRIAHVAAADFYTLFISGPNRGTWGFLVDEATGQRIGTGFLPPAEGRPALPPGRRS